MQTICIGVAPMTLSLGLVGARAPPPQIFKTNYNHLTFWCVQYNYEYYCTLLAVVTYFTCTV